MPFLHRIVHDLPEEQRAYISNSDAIEIGSELYEKLRLDPRDMLALRSLIVDALPGENGWLGEGDVARARRALRLASQVLLDVGERISSQRIVLLFFVEERRFRTDPRKINSPYYLKMRRRTDAAQTITTPAELQELLIQALAEIAKMEGYLEEARALFHRLSAVGWWELPWALRKASKLSRLGRSAGEAGAIAGQLLSEVLKSPILGLK